MDSPTYVIPEEKEVESEVKYIVYALRCRDEKYYIGRTSKTIEERFLEHLAGKG